VVCVAIGIGIAVSVAKSIGVTVRIGIATGVVVAVCIARRQRVDVLDAASQDQCDCEYQPALWAPDGEDTRGARSESGSFRVTVET
jgi:hypothetical protein